MRCSYRSCGKSRRTSPGLSIYGFPVKDEERCKRWIINSGNRLDIPLIKYEIKGLCEDHFITEDFVNETKHRLIQMAVPKHHTDPLGHARRKERGLDGEKEETSGVKDISTKVLSLSEKLQRDIEKMQMDETDSRPVVSASQGVRENKHNEGNTDVQPSIPLRHDLFDRNKYKLQLMSRTNQQIKCFVGKNYKKNGPGGSTRKLQWLEELLKERALNKRKNASYYININDLLASFEILESSDFTDLELGWHTSKNKENVKCYSRKSNHGGSARRFSSQISCSEDSNKNDPLSLAVCQVAKLEDEIKNSWLKDELEEVEDYKDVPDMLLSSEYEFMGQDVKDEGISECQFQWSEEDKSCIRIVNISELQADRFKDESKNISPPCRMYRRKVGRRRFKNIQTTETEKLVYIINRNRLQMRILKSKLRKCHKELNALRKSQTM